MGNKLYVGNLSYNIRDDDLQQAFAQYGTVSSAKVMMDRDTGRSKGFGFVEMGSDPEAQAAINGMNGQALDGRAIVVNEARPREERPGGFGGAEPMDPRVSAGGSRVQPQRRDPELALDRACGHIDELHPAIRDDDEPAHQDPVRHQQVGATLRVSPRGVIAADDDEPGRREQRDDHDRDDGAEHEVGRYQRHSEPGSEQGREQPELRAPHHAQPR